MGQKVHPKIFRIPKVKEWQSKWFALGKDYAKLLKEDQLIYDYLAKRLKGSGVSNIEISRTGNNIKVFIYTAKPGLVIGRGGVGAQNLKKELEGLIDKNQVLELSVFEEKQPELSAGVLVEEAVNALEKRVPYRRVMKRIIDRISKSKAKGGKIILKGRLDGIEIARSEKMIYGKMPLHTIDSDIDYAQGVAFTTYGCVGVKVWIYKGTVRKEEK
ncbi:30S ribosomal protein S3 [bacterium]|nr:30S ribosomal protein S3 [bacterium]